MYRLEYSMDSVTLLIEEMCPLLGLATGVLKLMYSWCTDALVLEVDGLVKYRGFVID